MFVDLAKAAAQEGSLQIAAAERVPMARLAPLFTRLFGDTIRVTIACGVSALLSLIIYVLAGAYFLTPVRRPEANTIVFSQSVLAKLMFILVGFACIAALVTLMLKLRKRLSAPVIGVLFIATMTYLLFTGSLVVEFNNAVRIDDRAVWIEMASSAMRFDDLSRIDKERVETYRTSSRESIGAIIQKLSGDNGVRPPPRRLVGVSNQLRFVRKDGREEVHDLRSTVELAAPEIFEFARKRGVPVRDTTIIVDD